MNEFENKLNRSHSESDLYVSTQNSPTINRLLSRDIYKSSPTIIRRTFCIEEVILPVGTMKPHNSRKHIIGNTNFDQDNSLSFSDLGYDSNRFLNQHSTSYSLDQVPMEIDYSYNYDERYPKMMGSGPGTPTRREDTTTSDSHRFKALENNLKQRLSTQNLNRDREEFQQKSQSTTLKGRNLADPQKITHLKTVQRKTSRVKTVFFVLMAVIALFFGYSTKIFSKIFVNSDVQIQNILEDLSKNVFDQQNVIDVVVRSLEQRETWPGKKKLLGFIGSQGVGKTHVANILKKHYAINLAHEIYGPHLYYKSEKDKVLDSLDDCCLNLLVIDDLEKKDIVELFAFIHALPKNIYVMIISVFNIHYVTGELQSVVNKEDIIEVRDSLDQSGLNQELVVFRDFTIEQIEKWAEIQLDIQNVSSAVKEQVMQNIFYKYDIKHGLKGLHSKISLELEKTKH